MGQATLEYYNLTDRDIVNSQEWRLLCRRAQVSDADGVSEVNSDYVGFENEVFAIRPYDWSEPKEYLPNFEYKPSGFKIWWYKYPFRSSNMSSKLSSKEIKRLFQKCADSISVPITVDEETFRKQLQIQQELKQTVEKLNQLVKQAGELQMEVQIDGNSNMLLERFLISCFDEGIIEFYSDLKNRKH